ncbi:tetratricopeptide repeat protein [Agrobacterium bohemicum]|uniref:Uncharacterized protein n=1 Tax=Agrobacterium bohemicum TaxID=2052828 RepID=A0A135P809_9HYPH|nr:hypothetical protein [Agrobacterium bohemicum]KXG87562.1 hypothetical protein ATO67_18095 [Agrobacterium bohemicum]
MTANGEFIAGAITDKDARAEAERLLSDPRFHASERHRAFLKYICDALFEGRSQAVKAYSIAIDVFNRPTTFDPSSDPIVRIEATRLREALAKYYEQICDEDGVRLDIARGRYIPVFTSRGHAPCVEEEEYCVADDDVVPPAVMSGPSPDRRAMPLNRTFSAFLASMAIVAVCYIAYQFVAPPHRDTDRPVVEMTFADSSGSPEAHMLSETLASSMMRFGTVRLKTSPVSQVANFPAVEQSAYDVSVRYSEDNEGIYLRSRVSDHATGETIWTNEDRRPLGGGVKSKDLTELIHAVSRKIAGPVGVVNATELRQQLPLSTTGNLCVLRGEAAVDQRSYDGLKTARLCLEATIAVDPGDADAMATLARVYLWTGRATGDTSLSARSLELANRSAVVSPNSARAALAQMATLYQVGQNDMSIAAGRRGIVLNPENADLRAKLAIAVFLSGHWEEGVKLAREAVELSGETLRDASFVMILDAYRQGQYAEAVFLARQVPTADTPIAILKLAAVARMGDKANMRKEIAVARMQHPDLERVISSMLTGARYDRDLEQALRVGIRETGLTSSEFAAHDPM